MVLTGPISSCVCILVNFVGLAFIAYRVMNLALLFTTIYLLFSEIGMLKKFYKSLDFFNFEIIRS